MKRILRAATALTLSAGLAAGLLTVTATPAAADDRTWSCVWVVPLDRAVCFGDFIQAIPVPTPLGPSGAILAP